MRLSELKTGESGIIVKTSGRGAFRKRLLEMGFVRGKDVEVIRNAPLKDPIQFHIMGYDVSLRRKEAELIEVLTDREHLEQNSLVSNSTLTPTLDELREIALEKGRIINVAFVGNPNCGKTTLFNHASGSHEHVGNYSGVTVDAKEATFRQDGYTFKIVDLPGTYSLTSYTPEEIYVNRHLQDNHPDVVVNVVDASNLERNLYLTSQLIDMNAISVIALNMYDELARKGDKFAYDDLGKMIGMPIVPTVARSGEGVEQLFKKVIEVYEGTDPDVRHVHINYGSVLERTISSLKTYLKENTTLAENISLRYVAIKLLERDKEMETQLSSLSNHSHILEQRDTLAKECDALLKQESETAFTDARYGFIDGALKETYSQGANDQKNNTKAIDKIVTNKYLGFPIFIIFMWLMFQATFYLGGYPMEWIEAGVGYLGDLLQSLVPEGAVQDLLVDGIIGGVGGVIVFLPNIVILYAFIAFMEGTGYMARVAFIMDKLMHKIGLHGKSFIPLIMGFGCSVPAIMATRTIESRSSRMITMLINPLFSCSARMPVYLLLVGVAFPKIPGTMLLVLYLAGIALAVVMAKIFRKFLFPKEEVPFVMELPPYRMPTIKATVIQMWEKSRQYLKKMGGVILIASIVIWFLSYFPQQQEGMSTQVHQEQSYIGKIGKGIEPVMRPLGFDWKMSVGVLTGAAAKEVVVSTLGVLYTGDDDGEDIEGLAAKLREEKNPETGEPLFTPLIALSFLLFVLLYFPCIAAIVAVVKESGSWKWGAFVIGYTTILAWIVSFIVYQVGSMIL
ncbi:MAG: ferrous iron transport protein B [Rikenellaceae bacterium]